ncbi:protein kinase, partial [bacterium]|nr:protein kinase [bacterium]
MVGKVVSHYHITERLGGGAMGVVYRAEDILLRRPVALKFLPAELTGDEESNRRFMREARAVSALDHPNICTVHEIGETEDGELFIVMPFYRGRTLKTVLAEGPLDPASAVNYAQQVAAGIAHANEHGVVHRDIKPANIMVTDRDSVKIVDFGLALLQGGRRLTRTGAAVGTAAYMAPEQVLGAEVGPAADIWSLGVVLFEMLTGRLPFAGETEPAMLYSIVHGQPAPLSGDGRQVPTICESIVGACLVKDAGGRYGSSADLKRDLEEASRILTPQPGTRQGLQAARPGRLRRLALPALLAVVLALAAFTPTIRDAVLKSMGLAAEAPRGVAVLPFDVVGCGAQEQAFADGLTWLLTDRLSRLEEHDSSYWVVPAQLVRENHVVGSDDARLLLGVDYSVKGTLRFTGSKIALSLLAYDALRGEPRTREIDDDLANLETWQHQVSRVVAGMLGVDSPEDELLRPSGRGCTTVPESFAWLLRGLGWLNPSRGEPDHLRARDAFGAAVAQDSSFACAYTGLGRAVWLESGQTDSLAAVTAAGYLRRAVALDSTLVWPHVYLGEIQSRWWDNADAVGSLEHALALEPRHWR